MSKSLEPIQKVTLNLFAGDYEKLQAMYPESGAGPVVRKLVRSFINRVEQETPAGAPKVGVEL